MTMGKARLHYNEFEPAVEQLSDKYEVIDLMGGGGMGRVFHARHRQLKRPVAIKLLLQDIGGPDAVARFMREARTAAQIGSPHVAQVMDAGVLPNGHPYIVMEYLRGRDLACWLTERGRLPVADAVDFTLQALEALAEAHALQIVHRDIKPDNLFATETAGGETLIKVLDFGLAKAGPALESSGPALTERGAVLGTPSYMAPEQFVDAQQADVRSDIWAVGATLFELVTGAPPFSGTSLPQVYRAVMHRSIPTIRSLQPALPEWLEGVVATCLTRERELRYADAAELASALHPWVGPASQARIERIRRIVQGGRNEVSIADTLASGPQPLPPPRAASHGRRSQLRWLGAGLGVACSATLLWLFDSRPPQEVARSQDEAVSGAWSETSVSTARSAGESRADDPAANRAAAPNGELFERPVVPISAARRAEPAHSSPAAPGVIPGGPQTGRRGVAGGPSPRSRARPPRGSNGSGEAQEKPRRGTSTESPEQASAYEQYP
jgi:eukaryotic-like serine/threonine-protein kinase